MFDFNTNFIYSIPGLLSALVFYVYAQAKVADNLGDPTPRYCGRLTLNPLVHIDPWGLLCLLFLRMGWAKPVPINPYNFKNPTRGELEVSLAGPVANIVLAFACYQTWMILNFYHVGSMAVYEMLDYAVMYNLFFCFFNLIPIPPLTGARIVSALLPERYTTYIDKISFNPYSYLILLALMFLGVFSAIIYPLTSLTLHIFHAITGVILQLIA